NESPSPALESLVEKQKVVAGEGRGEGKKLFRLGLENFDQEIQTIARWAKSTHQINPEACIGCVIPTLDKNRDRVNQLFSEVFENQTNTFNISAGKSLSDYPVIHAAISLLQLHQNTITRESLSYLLTSPFLGESQLELTRRANLDRELR